MSTHSALDRYLAFHAPRLIRFNPKKSPVPVLPVAAVGAIFLVVATVLLVGKLVLSPIVIALVVFAALLASFMIQKAGQTRFRAEETYLASLYFKVYGQYGWNEDAGPQRSTEPVPIRASAKVLSQEAYGFLESAASQALRIHAAAPASDLAQRACLAVDQAMKDLFVYVPSIEASGFPPPEAAQALSQLTELADLISGVTDPIPALTSGNLSPLESMLLDARSERHARLEMAVKPEESEARQQDQL